MNYLDISKKFEEQTKKLAFFESFEIMSLKNNLLNIFQNDTKQLIFLIGEPGVGKSAFINHFEENNREDIEIIKFDIPFLEPVDFIKTLIKRSDVEVKNFSLEELIKQAIAIYESSNYVVIIDEAQLLSKDMIEIIRILADSKAFWFILAMHKHESKNILNAPQFSSRPHKILELNKLQKSEYKEYLYITLNDIYKPNLRDDLSDKYLKFIYKQTQGNFREFKKLLHTTFLLLNYAHHNNKIKHQNLSKCILTMAAIQNGLIHV